MKYTYEIYRLRYSKDDHGLILLLEQGYKIIHSSTQLINNAETPVIVYVLRKKIDNKEAQYQETFNPDWKGDPNDPLRWKGW